MAASSLDKQGTDIIAYLLGSNGNFNNIYVLIYMLFFVLAAIATLMCIALISNIKKSKLLMEKNTEDNDNLPSIIRISLAYSIFLIICGILVYSLLSGKFDIVTTSLSSIISIFGTIVGFYFGNKSK